MYFKTFQINDHIYQFKDPLGVLCTLIIGKEKAMLIDTCYGIGDLPSLIKNYTNLPLVVIASHGHMDHTGGNYQFEEVYINELDLELCKQYNSNDRCRKGQPRKNMQAGKVQEVYSARRCRRTFLRALPGRPSPCGCMRNRYRRYAQGCGSYGRNMQGKEYV